MRTNRYETESAAFITEKVAEWERERGEGGDPDETEDEGFGEGEGQNTGFAIEGVMQSVRVPVV